MSYEIDRRMWSQCNICGKDLKTIKSEVGGGNVYFSRAFKKHLKECHDLSLDDYFYNHLQMEDRICPCGICGKRLIIRTLGANISYREMACGRNAGVIKWSEEAKITRCGENNPMYGKTAWNLGKTKDDCEQLQNISDNMTGRVISEETKARQSDSAKKREIHGHTGHKHSEQTKEFLRENTLRLIREGVFKQVLSKPHLFFRDILDSLSVDFSEEKTIFPYSFDFYLEEIDILVEIDGDYFHSNPISYPHGPISKTQKINYANDIRKNKFVEDKKLRLLRFWECDILNKREDIICKLKELYTLKRLGLEGLSI